MNRLESWLRRRGAYRSTFLRSDDGKPDMAGQLVLADLARFCCQNRTTIRVSPTTRTIDPMAMAVREGRREVFMRIAKFIHLSDAEVTRLLQTHEGE